MLTAPRRARIAMATIALSLGAAVIPAVSASAATNYGIVTIYNNCSAKASFSLWGTYSQYGIGTLTAGAKVNYTVPSAANYVVNSSQRTSQPFYLATIPGRTSTITVKLCA